MSLPIEELAERERALFEQIKEKTAEMDKAELDMQAAAVQLCNECMAEFLALIPREIKRAKLVDSGVTSPLKANVYEIDEETGKVMFSILNMPRDLRGETPISPPLRLAIDRKASIMAEIIRLNKEAINAKTEHKHALLQATKPG